MPPWSKKQIFKCVCMNDNNTTCPHTNWNLCWSELFFLRPNASLHLSHTLCLLFNFTTWLIYRFRLRILRCDIPKYKRRIFCFSRSQIYLHKMLCISVAFDFDCFGFCSLAHARAYWYSILIALWIYACGQWSTWITFLLFYSKNSLSPSIRIEFVFVYMLIGMSLTNSKSMMIWLCGHLKEKNVSWNCTHLKCYTNIILCICRRVVHVHLKYAD